MSSSKVANRYASSLFENSVEKNNLETVYEDINLLIRTFDESSELRRAVESPVIKPELKISVLDEIFSNKLSKDTLKFVSFIVDKKREKIPL